MQLRGKGRTMKENPIVRAKRTNLKVTKGQRNKLCSKAPTNCQKHIRKGREGNNEIVISLEEPSPTMMVSHKNRNGLHSTKLPTCI
jgi:hypothetical protein